MIKYNQNYGNIEVNTLLEFGKGDILVGNAENIEGNHVSVIMKNQEPTPVGTEDNSYSGKTTDEYMPELIMMFDKVDSIDVVIEHLQAAKNNLLKIRDV